MNQLWWLVIPAAYLLGSISFAWIAGRIKGVDLRQQGSGNLGATNAGRVLGWHWFALVFSLDLAKGVGPVLLAQHSNDPWLPIAAGAAAVLGHVFTCFHRFKGGKAVATSLGVIIGLAPLAALIIFGTWVVAWAISWSLLRQGKSGAVGPASVVAALAAVPAYLASGKPSPPTLGFLALLALLVLVKHRSNMRKFIDSYRANAPAKS